MNDADLVRLLSLIADSLERQNQAASGGRAACVFDFDGAIFRTLCSNRGKKDFLAYVRYYVSDHRPGAQFKT